MATAVRIDGSHGEGGGQILRTALALSAIVGRHAEIVKIRARRKKPGLQPQHLTAVTAVARVAEAEVDGAELGSTSLTFRPRQIRGGDFVLEVGTAGATTLVFQAMLWPLAVGAGRGQVVIRGGTHVPYSPPFHYLRDVFLPAAAALGLKASTDLLRWGFYPRGAGGMRAEVHPPTLFKPVELVERPAPTLVHGISAVVNLPRSIGDRQRERAAKRLKAEGLTPKLETVEASGLGQGTFLFLALTDGPVPAGFSALGERGKPAERIADETVDRLLDFARSGAAVELHLADQLLLPMALAPGPSVMTVERVTEHLVTNAWVIEQFLPAKVSIEGKLGKGGRVAVEGARGKAAAAARRRAQ
jgi:RNA 3'-phosphate cyclase